MRWHHNILIEILQHESLPSQSGCSHCQQMSGTYQCQDCFGSNLLCGACCVSAHARLPFHCVQMWNGHFFEKSDLLALEFTLDLIHEPNNCLTILLDLETEMMFNTDISNDDNESGDNNLLLKPSESMHYGTKSFLTIVSSTGIFRHSVRWCHCAKSSDQYVELLLCSKLFPASFKNLKTAFTFEVLDHFQVDALECNTAAMNFMSKIQRITDEVFPSQVPVSFLIHFQFIGFSSTTYHAGQDHYREMLRV